MPLHRPGMIAAFVSGCRIASNSLLWAFMRRLSPGVTADRGEYRSRSPWAANRIPNRAKSVIRSTALTIPPNRHQVAFGRKCLPAY
jgi:hypothetical protein